MAENRKINSQESFSTTGPAGVDGAVGVPEPKWFVAIVNSRHEKVVADHLSKLPELIEDSYVATQKEMKVWKNGRRKLIDRVVIPSMVFVKCTENQRRTLVTFPYINRFLVNRSANSNGLNKPVAVIGDEEIAKLKFMLGQSERPVDFVSTIYKVKDTVRVVRGKLCGLTGEILTDSDGTSTLMVGIAMLGGAKVQIDSTDVEKIN